MDLYNVDLYNVDLYGRTKTYIKVQHWWSDCATTTHTILMKVTYSVEDYMRSLHTNFKENLSTFLYNVDFKQILPHIQHMLCKNHAYYFDETHI